MRQIKRLVSLLSTAISPYERFERYARLSPQDDSLCRPHIRHLSNWVLVEPHLTASHRKPSDRMRLTTCTRMEIALNRSPWFTTVCLELISFKAELWELWKLWKIVCLIRRFSARFGRRYSKPSRAIKSNCKPIRKPFRNVPSLSKFALCLLIECVWTFHFILSDPLHHCLFEKFFCLFSSTLLLLNGYVLNWIGLMDSVSSNDHCAISSSCLSHESLLWFILKIAFKLFKCEIFDNLR